LIPFVVVAAILSAHEIICISQIKGEF